ncbi:uncharacterized protein LOC143630482 [Bidens hawaiensis]|uniref:uncharacterized protein LOC143630482 n=1 Tax=Bidens hawaiensis TaxID=980011 RepID=UPI0040493667
MIKVFQSNNRLYMVKLTVGAPVCLLSKLDDLAWLWHVRMGHLKFEAMKALGMKNMGEAMRHTVYILNQVSTRVVKAMTPYEALLSRKPTIEHLTVFGCVGFVKEPKINQEKHDDWSRLMVCFGNEQDTKAYRMYGPTQQKIFECQDVRFDEKHSWEWMENKIQLELGEFIIEISPYIITNEMTQTPAQHSESTFDQENSHRSVQLQNCSGILTGSGIAQSDPTETKPVQPDSTQQQINPFAAQNSSVADRNSPGTTQNSTENLICKSTRTRAIQLRLNDYRIEDGVTSSTSLEYQAIKIVKGLTIQRCEKEQAVYKKYTPKSVLVAGIYVDDLVVTDSNKTKINEFKKQMVEKFEMSDLGKLSYYLGIEVNQMADRIAIKQESYALKILKEANLQSCNTTYCLMQPTD